MCLDAPGLVLIAQNRVPGTQGGQDGKQEHEGEKKGGSSFIHSVQSEAKIKMRNLQNRKKSFSTP